MRNSSSTNIEIGAADDPFIGRGGGREVVLETEAGFFLAAIEGRGPEDQVVTVPVFSLLRVFSDPKSSHTTNDPVLLLFFEEAAVAGVKEGFGRDCDGKTAVLLPKAGANEVEDVEGEEEGNFGT